MSKIILKIEKPIKFKKVIDKYRGNPYLAYTKDEVLSWPFEVQARMGYSISSPNVGARDFLQPYSIWPGIMIRIS